MHSFTTDTFLSERHLYVDVITSLGYGEVSRDRRYLSDVALLVVVYGNTFCSSTRVYQWLVIIFIRVQATLLLFVIYHYYYHHRRHSPWHWPPLTSLNLFRQLFRWCHSLLSINLRSGEHLSVGIVDTHIYIYTERKRERRPAAPNTWLDLFSLSLRRCSSLLPEEEREEEEDHLFH